MTRVAVVTIHWNRAEVTARLLASLRTLALPHGVTLQVVVVDNGSTDGSGELLKRDFPEIALLPLPENAGYAGAVNQGMARALAGGADFLWVLNNDTVAAPDSVARLLAAADDHTILSPLIYYLSAPDRIWFAGGAMDIRLKTTHVGQDETDRGQYAGLRRVPWLSGCAPFFSRKVAERVGPWPTEYFLYLEDVDWCLTARELGIGCAVLGEAHLWHDVSTSAAPLGNAFVRYYAWRNYYLLGRRHGHGLQRWRIEADLWFCLARSSLRWLLFPSYRHDSTYHARTHGLVDLIRGRVGKGVGAWQSTT